MKKKIPQVATTQENLVNHYLYTFAHGKSSIYLPFYLEEVERLKQERPAFSHLPKGWDSPERMSDVFWWFIKFVNSCRGVPGEVVVAIAEAGRPRLETDYQLMCHWAAAMHDRNYPMSEKFPDFRFLHCLYSLSQEQLKAESITFVVAARAMVDCERRLDEMELRMKGKGV